MKRLALILTAAGVGGVLLILTGIALVYPPAALVATGLVLVALAAFGLSRDIGAIR